MAAPIEGDSSLGTPGVRAGSASSTAALVAANTNGANAIIATSSGVPIYAETSSTSTSYGAVYGRCTANAGNGVIGIGVAFNGTGVRGVAYIGVYGDGGSYGVWGQCGGSNGTGVLGKATANSASAAAVYGSTVYPTTAYGGYFDGKGYFSQALTKAGGGFLIDHPLDPANKTLTHSFVESPEMKNIYDGVGVVDSSGELIVDMPSYFEALNMEFRYQLTPIGAPAPNLHIKQTLEQGRFTIAGAAAGQEVCWQVTGVRKDAWAQKYRLAVEEDKPADERGLYLNHEAFGEGPEKSVHLKRRPQVPVEAAAP